MAGEHLKDLLRRTTGMSSDDVTTAQGSWAATTTALGTIYDALDTASKAIPAGIGGPETRDAAKTAFTQAAAKIGKRRDQMNEVSTALSAAATAMSEAEKAAQGAPDAPPATAPSVPEMTGDIDKDAEAMAKYADKVSTYNGKVSTYGDADEKAREKIQTLLTRYDEAYTALQKIEGQPKKPGENDDKGPGGPGIPHVPLIPGPNGTMPGHWVGTSPLPDGSDIDFPDPTDVGGIGDGGGVGGVHPVAAPPIVHTLNPDLPPLDYDPEIGSGGGPNLGQVGPAVLGGGLAAGAFGAPGLIRGLKGLVGGRGLSGSSVGSIGASARTGGPGALGRGAVGGPGAAGSPVSRAGGRGSGAAGRTGRGGAGGRGGVAGAAGGRGRRRDQREGEDRDLFDDGQDWVDDEGAAPGVLD